MTMYRTILYLVLFATAGLATALFPPSAARAQVGRDSNWVTDTGDLRIYVPDSPSYPRENWRNGAGPRVDIAPRAAVVMEGEFRNLRWKGNYWVMTSRDHKPHGSMCLGSRPTLYTAADDSYDYGIFDVTFNAAENSFTGTRQWQCRYPDGRTRTGPIESFSGSRSGITAAMQPTLAVPTAPIVPNPASAGSPDSWLPDRRNCSETRGMVIRADGRDIPTTSRYVIRPCTLDALAGDKFQIDMPNPEGKRPMRLALRGFDLSDIQPDPERRTLILTGRFTPDTYAQGLPFAGDPRPGSSIMNLTMSGRFCNSAFWIAYLDFSDGSQSEPIGALLSKCGARLHPEQLPPLLGPRAGEGDGVRRANPKPR